MGRGVCQDHAEAFGPADVDKALVDVHPVSRDAAPGQHGQPLASTRAHVDQAAHADDSVNVGQVDGKLGSNLGFGTPEAILERRVDSSEARARFPGSEPDHLGLQLGQPDLDRFETIHRWVVSLAGHPDSSPGRGIVDRIVAGDPATTV
jgi:hypothetical protein